MSVTTTDLAAWLTQIWDEEERLAKSLAMVGRPLEGGWGSWFQTKDSIGDRTGYVVAYGVQQEAARKHIVLHDPASVLARIAADRKILELHSRLGDYCNTCGGSWPCATVRFQAEPYADRPGYREEWKP